MRKLSRLAVLCVTVACVTGIGLRYGAVAQESGKAASKAEKAEGKKDAKKGKSDNRLPSNYGKIGLSEDQRKKIYEIQDRYSAQIDELEKRIAELKAKQTAETEAVLTAEQRTSLQTANEESKKKAAETKKKAAEKTVEAKGDTAAKGETPKK